MTGPQQSRIPTSALSLEFPMSLGVYDTYEQAMARRAAKDAAV